MLDVEHCFGQGLDAWGMDAATSMYGTKPSPEVQAEMDRTPLKINPRHVALTAPSIYENLKNRLGAFLHFHNFGFWDYSYYP